MLRPRIHNIAGQIRAALASGLDGVFGSLSIDGVTRPTEPRFPVTSADMVALTGLTPYEIWVPHGQRLRGMVNDRHLTAGSGITPASFGPGVTPWSPARSAEIVAANANAKFTASANTILDLAALTAANNLLVLAHFCSNSADANYSMVAKYQSAATLWDFGVTQAGELQIYTVENAHAVFPVTSGLALRDGKPHLAGWAFDWSATGAEIKMAAEVGNSSATSKGTVAAITNTGKLTLGGTDAAIASFAFGCDWIAAFTGAQISGVVIKDVIADLGWTVTGA